MKDKILKIQNKAKSLMWGCTRHSETSDLFAVGHKSYPCEVYYLVVSDDFMVLQVNGNMTVLVKKCASEDEVLEVIYELLKQWFPAKGGKTDAT